MNHFLWKQRVEEAHFLAKRIGMSIISTDFVQDNKVVLVNTESLRFITSGDIRHIEEFILRCFKLKAFL